MQLIKNQLTNEQYLDIYYLVFKENIGSDEEKINEIQELLFDCNYWFIIRTNKTWKTDLINYLDKLNYKLPEILKNVPE